MNFWQIQKDNKRKTLFIVLILIAILCIIGYTVDYQYSDFYRALGGFDFPIATTIALIIGVGQSVWAYYWGDKAILATTGARPLDLNELREKQVHNIVEEMSIAAGIPMPFVYVVEQGGPNAFATGRDPMHASIAVTRELMNVMNREEIQGVVAHEMAHIRNRDTLTLTVTVALAGSILLLSDMARRMMYSSGGSSRGRSSKDSGGNGIIAIIGLILIILAPIIVRLLSLAVSRSREYAADAGGVEFTRNPMGLAGALQKIDDYYKGKLDLSKLNQEAATEKSKHLSNSPLDPLQMPIPVPPLGMPNKPIPPQNTGSKLTPEQTSSIDAMMQGYSEKDKYNKLAGLGSSLSANAHTSFNSHNVDINTIFSDYSSTSEAVGFDKKNYGVASLFIYNPLDGPLENSESWWANLWETHPPIQQRINILMGKAKLQGMLKKNP